MTFGSSPGEPTERLVEELIESDGVVKVRPVGSDEIRSYKLFYILWIEVQGQRLDNPRAIAARQAALAQRASRVAARDALEVVLRSDLAAPAPGQTALAVLQEVEGSWDDQPRKFFVVARPDVRRRLAVIHARSPEAAQRLCACLDGRASFWDTVDVLLRHEFFWPAWIRVRQDMRDEADLLRGDLPTLRERQAGAPLPASGAEPDWTEAEQRALYASHSRFSANAEPWANYHLVRVLEASEPDYRKAFALPAALPSQRALQVLFTKGWDRNRVFTLPADFLDLAGDMSALRRAGLVIDAAKLPTEELFAILPYGTLMAPLKVRAVKLPKRDKETVRAWYARNLDPALEAELRSAPWIQSRAAFRAPPGFSWAEFQELRDAYSAMTRDLVCWLSGDRVDPKDEAEYLKLI